MSAALFFAGAQKPAKEQSGPYQTKHGHGIMHIFVLFLIQGNQQEYHPTRVPNVQQTKQNKTKQKKSQFPPPRKSYGIIQ